MKDKIAVAHAVFATRSLSFPLFSILNEPRVTNDSMTMDVTESVVKIRFLHLSAVLWPLQM